MANLLLEIGSEEIPASYLGPAADSLGNSFKDFLQKKRIAYKEIEIFFTPRRIAVLVKGIGKRQEVWEEEIPGPPKTAALKEDGSLTPQGEAFLRANKAKNFYLKNTPKGEYIFIKKKMGGEETVRILRDFLPSAILSLPFPKNMRWSPKVKRCAAKATGGKDVVFARPIRWLSVLFDNRVIKFPFFNIPVANFTFGNRYFQKKIFLKEAKGYEGLLKRWWVIPNFSERKEIIKRKALALADKIGGEVFLDADLLEEVANTLEFPKPIIAQFEKRFLSLPAPVISTVLKKHLRAFSVKKKGKEELLPYFLVFVNNPFGKEERIREWYERSAKSRLEDAKFFYEEDLKIGLLPLVEKEKEVIWIEGLGSLYDKTQRLVRFSEYLAGFYPEVGESLRRAAFLSKADLLTNIVREKELTSLQGVMGGIYAQGLGESEEVMRAIGEQYLPVPNSKVGALLALADRFDNLVASFLKGEIPTGSYDPFGLKRMADTIIEILSHHNFFLSLDEGVDFFLKEFGSQGETKVRLLKFFRERVHLFLEERGYRYDIADSLVFLSPLVPKDLEERASALQKFRRQREEEFQRLVIGQKRVKNILREADAKKIPYGGGVAISLLQEAAEKDLYKRACELEGQIILALNEKRYEETLNLLLSFREGIDRFFDEVLVMTEVEELRRNRLALLSYIKSLFYSFCDFSLLVLEGK